MIAASPNWRSRSSSSVRFPQCLASDAERFVDSTVLPVPPLGEKTVTRRPCRPLRDACSTICRWPPVRVDAPSRTLSLEPTSSISGCLASASRRSGRPSQTPVTKTRTLSRLLVSISFMLIEGLLPEGAARAAAEAVAEHRLGAVEVVGTVGCVGDGPELEVPGAARRRVAVREHPLVLLGLAVGHLAAGCRPAGGLEHFQVA